MSDPPAAKLRHIRIIVLLVNAPGALAAVTARLARLGVNIDQIQAVQRHGGWVEDHIEVSVTAGPEIRGLIEQELIAAKAKPVAVAERLAPPPPLQDVSGG